MSGSISTNAVGAPARFQVSNGQVLDPQGAVFKARGINVAASRIGDANKILADFPGLNFIRVNVFDYASPDAYAAFISAMTSHGVVVEFEDHTSSSSGGRKVAFNEAQLGAELKWYQAAALAYASNPYVWFGTDNDPPVEGITPWQQQTYDAIRIVGNNNPIVIELPGGGWPDGQTVTTYGMDPNVYAAMSNVVADVHLFGWSSRYAPDQAAVDYSLANMIQGARTIPSANGPMPVLVGQYGPSTYGSTADANAAQVLRAAQQSSQTAGAVAFAWSGGGAPSLANNLTDEQGNLTAYGQQTAQWIASASGAASPSPTGTPGRFQVSNGQVLDPQGAVFKARGMNVASSQMGYANKILADFPGLNFVRVTVFDYASPDAYAAFISAMTSRGVVVELEDHTSSNGSNNGGSRGVAFTGTQLANELNWYSAVARAYASNPYVWFGTDNEPPVEGISPWQQQTYNAIRSAGNNNPIMIELPGGGWPDGQTVISYGMDPNVYAAMSNIVADVHMYGWSSRYVPDQTAVDYSLANMIQSARTIPSMNGVLPVILGEYGPSTEGPTADPNAAQVLLAAQRSTQTSGALAFTWNGGGADTLTDAQTNLTPYGQEVAQWIASGAPPASAVPFVQSAAMVSQAAVSAAATSGASMSFISGSNGATSAASGTGGGNVYVLPAAGNGVLGFTSDILDAGGTLDLTAALAATDWNGAASALPDYLAVANSPQGATISIASTFDGPRTAIATIPGATSLDLPALLAHSVT